jgi:hypothetical protein
MALALALCPLKLGVILPGRRRHLLSVVNLPPVTKHHDDDQKHVVSNRVDDAVIPDTNPEAGPASKGP